MTSHAARSQASEGAPEDRFFRSQASFTSSLTASVDGLSWLASRRCAMMSRGGRASRDRDMTGEAARRDAGLSDPV